MRVRSLALAVASAGCVSLVGACAGGDEEAQGDGGAPEGGTHDGAASGGRAAAGGSGGTPRAGGATGAGGASLPPVTCGTETCEPPDRSTGLQALACCTLEGACGLRLPISQKCLPFRQPGHLDPLCPTYEQAQLTLRGCCSPRGCGAWATFSNVGCIPNGDLGHAEVSCDYDKLSGDAAAALPGDAAARD